MAGESSESTAPSRREMWTSAAAILLTASHVVAGIIVFGWFYFVVPRWKKAIDDLGQEISEPALLLIQQSDLFVNYWYLVVLPAPVALVVDFIILRWLAKYLGVAKAIGLGICVPVLILFGMWLGHSVLKQELSRLRGQAASASVSMKPVGS